MDPKSIDDDDFNNQLDLLAGICLQNFDFWVEENNK